MSKLSRILPKEIKQMKFETQLMFYLGCNFTKSQLKAASVIRHVLTFPGVPDVCFANFTTEIIGNQTGLLINFVDLRKLVNKSET